MSYHHLFSPAQLGLLSLKNRIVLAPLTRGRAGPQRIPNHMMGDYYLQRAEAGMLISEATVISEQGNGWVNSPGIYTDEMTEGWFKINRRLRPFNTPLVLQMWHCGRASHSDFHQGKLPVSASAVKIQGDMVRTPYGKKDYETPRALTTAEVKDVVLSYGRAAERAKEAEFSGVEVHAANGYLINQFLDSKTNKRTDEYGGSLENRCRLLHEILQQVCAVFPSEQVGVRLSPNGLFNDMGGSDFREIYTYVIKLLDNMNLAYLHVMDGLAFGFHEQGAPFSLSEASSIYSGNLIGNCGYDAEAAEKQIAEGYASAIAFGRPFITNPDFPSRIEAGKALTPWDDMSDWYTSGSKGYTDYPRAC